MPAVFGIRGIFRSMITKLSDDWMMMMMKIVSFDSSVFAQPSLIGKCYPIDM
jgi:hypothetical protein